MPCSILNLGLNSRTSQNSQPNDHDPHPARTAPPRLSRRSRIPTPIPWNYPWKVRQRALDAVSPIAHISVRFAKVGAIIPDVHLVLVAASAEVPKVVRKVELAITGSCGEVEHFGRDAGPFSEGTPVGW